MNSKFVTVKEFATLTGKFPNHIYLLIHKGNSYRKLKAVKQGGKWMIPTSEIDEFPFNKADKLRNELYERLGAAEQTIEELKKAVYRIDPVAHRMFISSM